MLGLMTMTWGWVDTTLAMTIGMAQEYVGPITGFPEAPVSLKKKLACLKRLLRDVPVLEPLKEEGAALIELTRELGTRRNNLVHGAAWQAHEGVFQALNLKVIAGKYAGSDHHFNIVNTHALNVKIGILSDDLTKFMLKVGETLDGHFPRGGGSSR
jgi:hypothetical protein